MTLAMRPLMSGIRDVSRRRWLIACVLFYLVTTDLARVLLLRQFELGALAGYTGAAFERFFATVSGAVWSIAALAIWTGAPFGAGLRLFSRKDF